MIVLLFPGFRPDRARTGTDPHLGAKMMLFVLGAAIAIAGIVIERNWLINVGIAVLIIGFLFRLKRGRSGSAVPEDRE